MTDDGTVAINENDIRNFLAESMDYNLESSAWKLIDSISKLNTPVNARDSAP